MYTLFERSPQRPRPCRRVWPKEESPQKIVRTQMTPHRRRAFPGYFIALPLKEVHMFNLSWQVPFLVCGGFITSTDIRSKAAQETGGRIMGVFCRWIALQGGYDVTRWKRFETGLKERTMFRIMMTMDNMRSATRAPD
jgi:hypothetical protein